MKKKPKLVTQYLEGISREALDNHKEIVKQFVGRRTGIYALYRKGKLYYAGLASNLNQRLKTHLKDKHRDSWDSFSVYLTIGDTHMRELESLVLRMVQPRGNSQLGRFSGAQDLWRVFEKEISDKQKRERNRIFMRDDLEPAGNRAKVKTIPIRGRYKGKLIRARLRPDRKVHMKGEVYSSPSAAATAARKVPTNGWWFWHYERGPGDWVRISELRD